jgi:hypothetical protein
MLRQVQILNGYPPKSPAQAPSRRSTSDFFPQTPKMSAPNNPTTATSNMTDAITAAPIIQEPEPESDFQCADCVLERRDVGYELLFILFLVIMFATGAEYALYGGQTARCLTIACKSSIFPPLSTHERMVLTPHPRPIDSRDHQRQITQSSDEVEKGDGRSI